MTTANKLTSIFAKLYGILALGKSEMNMNYKELRKDATRQGKQEVIFKEVKIQKKNLNFVLYHDSDKSTGCTVFINCL